MEEQVIMWKKRLLDLGRQNRLIHYKETKKGNIKLVFPDLDCIYEELVERGRNAIFEETRQEGVFSITTNKSETEKRQILKVLRDKTRLAKEEQGVHVLYLAMGFLKWKEHKDSEETLYSPLILVPVSLSIEHITAPYVLSATTEEVVTNPTLAYKLEKEYGYSLPEFVEGKDRILDYLIEVNEMVHAFGWDVELECSLNIFSYLKMKMYQDLTINTEVIKEHSILKAFGGDASEIKTLTEEFYHYNHDLNSKPTDTFQVLDADASQQDAILFSKKGFSFVLQGPPGTGKSQTITNIIAEAMAQKKKVLFVSEKMAALEVVYRRLQEAQLGEFCLPLHSHKANKKEVIEEINKTLQLDRVKLHEEVLYQLDVLQEQKKRLNQYAKELHTECSPLNQSIYEINGRLAKLYMRPDVEFELSGVERKTNEELHQYIYALEEYEKALDKFSCALEEHPLYGSTVESTSHEFRQEMDQKLEELLPKMRQISQVINMVMEEYDIHTEYSIEGVHRLIQVFDLAMQAPNVSKEWLYEEKLEQCIETAKLHHGIQQEYCRLQEALDLVFLVDYENIAVEEAITILNESIGLVKERLNPQYFSTNNEIIQSMVEIMEILKQEKRKFQELHITLDSLQEILGITASTTIGELNALIKLLELLEYNPKPTALWFDTVKWKSNLYKIREIEQASDELEERKKRLFRRFDADILLLDAARMLNRFEDEYGSMYRLLKKEYRKDMETIRSYCYEEGKRFTEDEILDLLEEVVAIQEQEEQLRSRREWLKRFLGSYYQEGVFSFEHIKGKMMQFGWLLDYYQGKAIPEKLKECLITGQLDKALIRKSQDIINGVMHQQSIQTLQNLLNFSSSLTQESIAAVEEAIDSLYESMNTIQQIFSLIRIKEDSKMPYSEGLSALKKLKRLQQLEDTIEEQKGNLMRLFPSLYQGFDTDWEAILKGLVWIDEMHILRNDILISDGFLEACMDQQVLVTIKETKEYLTWLLQDMEAPYEWLKRIYPGKNLEKERFICLETNLEQLIGNSIMIEEWLQYIRAKRNCCSLGLKEFIEEIEQMKLNTTLITDTFLKGFYQGWLDKMLPKFPALFHFQRGVREDTRNDFDKLDVTQFAIAQTRIRERLLEGLPNLDTSFSGEDEVSILKRELLKKQKRMSLRQLFSAIPNLMLSLKPCFLMSPLSVSLFLPQELYSFDLVIFDEASQIRTEDAIGAILRGKQLIIAGDSEQLPPTNFFTSGVASDTGRLGEEIEEKVGFDSILEEAASILPEQTLRWHYRSRHESLIAFSNATIYHHNLITFPSTVEQMEHQGVEYYYVEDGIYDRGGKKDNIEEAKEVARLVMQQVIHMPDRSLGVITFSEAQQVEVERQLLALRMEHKEYEAFFAEDRPEPFFIKNLENVQGDERDTILFSIGYGKDSNGAFSMNFGPLSRSGGYRRLNVAITRAKYNIKLVGSIQPSDFIITESTSEGVKMLQAYIQYAMNRMSGELKEYSMIEEGTLSSSFEESIYDYLVSHNYKVATKVGCSGYRMDLAVCHPTLEGRYVLGIECDGATYYAARTVRERERLRHTVLKDMGWTIYRIWSTDWIKNPFIEGQKLLEAVESAIKEYNEQQV